MTKRRPLYLVTLASSTVRVHDKRDELIIDKHGIEMINVLPKVSISLYYRVGLLVSRKILLCFPWELRWPALAVGSYIISQSARGTSQYIIF